MRISDWSSDVCSSDLRDAQAVVAFAELARAARIVEMVFADEGRNHFGIEQLFGQAIDRPPLEIRIVDRPVVRAHSSEERRVGKECVSTCRIRGQTYT